MCQIDITIKKACNYCKIELSFHHPYSTPIFTINEHSTSGLRIPDTFVNCPNCGRPFYLLIQAQPYDLANHLDTSVAMKMYQEQQQTKKDVK